MSATPDILAAFVAPWLFFGGSAAVAVPILIHLLARRRFRRIRWAAIEFLLEAERRNRRRIRVEQLILLALRCLAVLLLALLVSRPFVQPGSLATLLGAVPRTDRIIVLDDSFSMGYADGNDAVFDRAKRVVEQLLRWVDRERAQDTVTLLVSSAPDRLKLDRVSLDAGVVDAAVEELGVLEASERRASPREVLSDVRAILESRGDAMNVAVYVISDFQQIDWVASPETVGADAAADPLASLAAWQGETRSLELMLVDVGPENARNIAVSGIRSLQPQVVAGVEAEFVVSVTNHAPEAVAGQALRVFLGDAALPLVVADAVAPGQTVTVPVRMAFPTPGYAALGVETPGDGLAVDDRRTLSVPVLPSVDVLVVNGAPSPHWYLDEVTVLKAALQPEGNVRSGNRVRVVEDTVLEEVDFRAYHLVVLANVFRVSEPAAEALSRYVAEGGGLILFLGDQVDADVYNRVLYRDGAGPLPASLGEPVETATRAGVGFAAANLTHPTTRIFQGQTNAVVGRIHFWSYMSSVPATSAMSLTTNGTPTTGPSGNGAGDDARGPARVILAFNDADQTPAVVERRYGKGRVVMVTSSCDADWNDWSADPSYVVLMLELARYAARSSGVGGDVLVGSPIRLTLDVDRYEPSAVLRPPGYPVEPQVDLAAVAGEDASAADGFALTWERTNRSGVYDFELTGRNGETDHHLVAVNVDPRESDLSRIDPVTLEQSMPDGLTMQYVRDLALGDEEASAARREYWPAVLVLLMGVLMAEQSLAWWFGRRS